MTNESNNSEFSDFINSIIKAAAIKKSAIELADHFSETFIDEDCLEFTSWFLYRLGSKHGINVLGIVKAMADNFPERYSELLLEGEDTASETIDGVEVICTDGRHLTFNFDDDNSPEEWDETPGSDDSSLWDELDD